MSHKVMHFEVQGRDGKRLQEFYASLFDWKIDANNPMSYGLVTGDPPGIAGGIGQSPRALVTFYVTADDLGAALKKAERLGGKTVMPPSKVPNGPEIAQFSDPEGNVIGLVKPEPM